MGDASTAGRIELKMRSGRVPLPRTLVPPDSDPSSNLLLAHADPIVITCRCPLTHVNFPRPLSISVIHFSFEMRLLYPLLTTALTTACFAGPSFANTSAFDSESAERTEERLPTDPERYLDIFEPFVMEQAALSPDGKLLALSHRMDGNLSIMIATVDEPQTVMSVIRIGRDASRRIGARRSKRDVPTVEVAWLGWISDERLVVQTERGQSIWRDYPESEIFAVNADGTGMRTYATPELLSRVKIKSYAPFHLDVEQKLTVPLAGAKVFREDFDRGTESHFHHFPHNSHGRDSISYGWHTIPILGTPASSAPVISRVRMPIEVLDYGVTPHEIIVRAGTGSDFDLYAINAVTGDKRIIRTERVNESRTALLNRQYEAKIALPSTTRTSWPHDYLYEDPHFFTLFRWKDLSEKLNRSAAAKARFSLSPDNLMADRSIPIGFDENPEILYFASDIGRDTFGIYAVNLNTGALTDFAIEHPAFDLVPPTTQAFGANKVLVYDRYSRNVLGIRYKEQFRTAAWIRSDWNVIQNTLEQTFPESSVDLLQWDREYERFLVRVEKPSDPGAFYIYDSTNQNLLRFGERGTGTSITAVETINTSVEVPGGRSVPVRLTIPDAAIHTPTPLVVLFSDNFWDRLSVDFDREAMALARMGYAVAQFSGRGAWGHGRASRTAFSDGHEVAQADEVVAIVEHLVAREGIHPDKVALVGEGIGGYLALRTLQSHHEFFRCAIAINAPLDPAHWIEKARWSEDDGQAASDLQLLEPYLGDNGSSLMASLLAASATLAKPVLLFAYRANDEHPLDPDYDKALTLVRNLRQQEIPVELVDLRSDYRRNLPSARADVFAHIAGFLNTHMFEYEANPRALELNYYGAVTDIPDPTLALAR